MIKLKSNVEAEFLPDKFKDECGVFGIYNNDNIEVAKLTYYALFALQHRGQESAGIAINQNGGMLCHKDMGLVPEVFNESLLNALQGKMAIGHVRYSTAGGSLRENAQPMLVKYKNGQLSLAHNGNIVNAKSIRKSLETSGLIFQSSADSELILNLIARHEIESNSMEESLVKTMQTIKGSYSLVIMTRDSLIAARDSFGIRPLCIGTINNSYVLASETCALDACGATFLRDVKPGEIIIIDENGLKSIDRLVSDKHKLCIFEHIYFARPDSILDGDSAYDMRLESGKKLAQESPVDADIVVGVPDSGLTAALGYSKESGIPYAQGMIKNRYVGRTFIKPDQGQRDIAVRLKLNALKSVVDGKRVIIIDDSIVRGTTSKRIVDILRSAGAREVHMRIASPPVKYPCFLGIDTPSKEHLIAANYSVEEIRDMIGADSLQYLTVDSIIDTIKNTKNGFCTGCFSGEYPVEPEVLL